jgi:hypothetical protein
MDRLTMCGAAAVMAVLVNPAAAQVTKTMTGETKNLTVTVEAIDHANRQVTGKKPDGTYEAFYVPESVRRFDTLKVGDKITAKYYENMVLQLKAPGDNRRQRPPAASSAPSQAPQARCRISGPLPRRSPRSIRTCHQSRSPGHRTGSTARA